MKHFCHALVLTYGLISSACSNNSTPEQTPQVTTPSWTLVYRHDADGKPVDGSKMALISAIRAGSPARFAWGVKIERDGKVFSVEHTADPVFLTIINESDVVVQLPEHSAQRSYVDMANLGFSDSAVMWRGLMGTDGTFDAVWVNRATGVEVRRYPQKVGLAWFALKPNVSAPQQAIELAVPGGVRKASAKN